MLLLIYKLILSLWFELLLHVVQENVNAMWSLIMMTCMKEFELNIDILYMQRI